MAKGLISWGEVADTLETLRVAIREARRREQLTLRDLCTLSGVSLNSLSRFERGADIRLSTALALIRWLNNSARVVRP